MFRSLFIGLTALSAISFFAETPAAAQDKSPECTAARRRLEQALKQPNTAPELLPETKKQYDVSFEKDETPTRPDCVEIKGRLKKTAADLSVPVTIYVFFKSDNSKVPNIKVGRIAKSDGRTLVSVLAVTSSGARAGVEITQPDPGEIGKHVVWLEQMQGLHGLVLCELTCVEVAKVTRPPDPPPPTTVNNSPKAGQSPAKPPAASPNAPVGADTASPPKQQQASNPAPPPTAAPAFDLDAKIEFEIHDDEGRISKTAPRLRPCNFDGKTGSTKEILQHLFRNCVDAESVPGYQFEEPIIDLSGKPKVTFRLKTIKPRTVSALRVQARMDDGSPITRNCTLNFSIVPANGATVEKFFTSPSSASPSFEFSAKLDPPIQWRNGKLTISAYDKADCEPEEAISKDIDDASINKDGSLIVPKVVLRSTLGEALIVLNAFTGIPSENGSSSTNQFYPVRTEAAYNEIYTEMIKRILDRLKGKVKTVKFLANSQASFYSERKVVNLTDSNPPNLAELANLPRLVSRNFDFTTMMDETNRFEAFNKRPFKYKIFIGLTGLPDTKNYCREFSQLGEKRANDEIYFYTFATTNNETNPRENELLQNTRNFPARACGETADPIHHFVLFPEAKKVGWEEVLGRLVEVKR